jgi:hypothetical protein
MGEQPELRANLIGDWMRVSQYGPLSTGAKTTNGQWLCFKK